MNTPSPFQQASTSPFRVIYSGIPIPKTGDVEIVVSKDLEVMRRLDLTGQKFGKWTALRRLPSGKWECRCKCGTVKAVQLTHLRSGGSKSCGCTPGQSSLFIDEIGNRHGRLTVLEEVKTDTSGASWLCRCDCGKELVMWGSNLRNGNTSSCGCYAVDQSREAKNVMVPGKIYGRLTCLERVAIEPFRWKFRCKCGWEGIKNHHQVIRGRPWSFKSAKNGLQIVVIDLNNGVCTVLHGNDEASLPRKHLQQHLANHIKR